MPNYLTITMLCADLLLFVRFSLAARYHFASAAVPYGMLLIAVLSLGAFGLFGWIILTHPPGLTAVTLNLLVLTCGALLFFRSILVTRSARLKLAFDRDSPTSLICTGPYRYIRHPFYASYIVFWIGCLIAAPDVRLLAFVLTLLATYALAALLEERAFVSSPHAAEYRAYQQSAGLFWPKVGATFRG